jgi:SAM-dependent methyltransferase
MLKKVFTNDYQEKAEIYAKHRKEEGTLMLAYNSFGGIFSKHIKNGNKAIDIGSGAGRSRKFLQEVGFDAYGVDIDSAMVNKAKDEDIENSEKYELIENGVIPHKSSKFDLAFSSLVVLEIPSMKDLISYFKEAERVLKFEGVLIVLTVTDDFYKYQWVSIDTNYSENLSPKSGDKVKVKIKEIDLELFDYYWTKKDYINAAQAASLCMVDEYYPIASKNDDISWISECEYPPFGIYVFRKTNSMLDILKVAQQEKLYTEIPEIGIFSEIERDSSKISINIKTDTETTQIVREKFSKIRLLLSHGSKINFHSLVSEEKLTHVAGNDVVLHLIDEDGNYSRVFLGSEDENSVQSVKIEPGTIFAEEAQGTSSYSIIEAENRPAFHPADVVQYGDEQITKKISNRSVSFFKKYYLKLSSQDTEEICLNENNEGVSLL